MADGFIGQQRAVWASGLRAPEKLVLLAVLDHSNDAGGVMFPGMGRLVQMTGLSRSSVVRSVGTLEAQGVLGVERRCGRSNSYRFNSRALPNQCQRDTSVSVTLVSEGHGTSVSVTPELVSEGHPKNQEKNQVTTKSSAARSRSGKSGASKKAKPKDVNPHAHGLKEHYVSEFERLRGTTPAFAGTEWGRAMKAFGQLADKAGPEKAREVITNALADAFVKRVQPWDLVREFNNHLGRRPESARANKPYRQSGADAVNSNTSAEFE